MKQSGFLQKQAVERQHLVDAVEQIIRQFMTDTAQIALNRNNGLGYDRCVKFFEDWRDVQREYVKALYPKDPECDVAQAHMDRELERIIRGKGELIPWEKRYPDMKRAR